MLFLLPSPQLHCHNPHKFHISFCHCDLCSFHSCSCALHCQNIPWHHWHLSFCTDTWNSGIPDFFSSMGTHLALQSLGILHTATHGSNQILPGTNSAGHWSQESWTPVPSFLWNLAFPEQTQTRHWVRCPRSYGGTLAKFWIVCKDISSAANCKILLVMTFSVPLVIFSVSNWNNIKY